MLYVYYIPYAPGRLCVCCISSSKSRPSYLWDTTQRMTSLTANCQLGMHWMHSSSRCQPTNQHLSCVQRNQEAKSLTHHGEQSQSQSQTESSRNGLWRGTASSCCWWWWHAYSAYDVMWLGMVFYGPTRSCTSTRSMSWCNAYLGYQAMRQLKKKQKKKKQATTLTHPSIDN